MKSTTNVKTEDNVCMPFSKEPFATLKQGLKYLISPEKRPLSFVVPLDGTGFSDATVAKRTYITLKLLEGSVLHFLPCKIVTRDAEAVDCSAAYAASASVSTKT